MKKISVMIYLLILVYLIIPGVKSEAKEKEPKLRCVSAVVMDQDSGRILYSKNGNAVLPMASTTKIVTAIVAIEKGDLRDMVVVSKHAAGMPGSSARLSSGEKINLEELLYGLMLRSGNDAAVAIAEHIGGTVEKFVDMMNEKAIELGAYSTSFKTPHGLDEENHFTTAEDLARITAYAMKNDFFSKLVSTKEISSGISGNFNRTYSNINKFLYRVDNSDGVKTGYTGNAGKCLVASVKHDYGRYICVVLNSQDRWDDAARLVEYAKDNYKYIKIMDKNEPVKRFRVYGGSEKYVSGVVRQDLMFPVKKDSVEDFKIDVYAPSAAFSPIEENEVLGNVVVTIDDKIAAKYPIYSDREVKRKNFINIIKQMFSM
ncbi:D-alanyl-D-alanine carboxypeptidase family protein [Fonticella tunisiensis]|uniref:serine-type D-Ala-D-Ala carboxypeptidase n=1 Tax=Fonticella tunisiensis TaxID=1096341 RepID=A0A4R7KRB1_9CLOT|nr:D-alanyl-D-alanine carboxypeptidase family protein [Fonticella tunisiensis]TDT61911.1 D-alanyl-D-alanine carboxypeptidase (penicillin-binding protein 5/6) [Fonticella tunisiensis]